MIQRWYRVIAVGDALVANPHTIGKLPSGAHPQFVGRRFVPPAQGHVTEHVGEHHPHASHDVADDVTGHIAKNIRFGHLRRLAGPVKADGPAAAKAALDAALKVAQEAELAAEATLNALPPAAPRAGAEGADTAEAPTPADAPKGGDA